MKGRTNNPNGRPPKDRTMSALLEKLGEEPISANDPTERKLSLVRRIWNSLLVGEVEFDSGRRAPITVDQWIALVKFVFVQIEGPPPTRLEHTGADGEPLAANVDHSISPETLATVLSTLSKLGVSGLDPDTTGTDEQVHPAPAN